MREQKHTQEPWRWEGHDGYIFAGPDDENPDGYVLLGLTGYTDNEAEDEANAARIVSCVNALAGVADPEAAITKAREQLTNALESAAYFGFDNYDYINIALAALTPANTP